MATSSRPDLFKFDAGALRSAAADVAARLVDEVGERAAKITAEMLEKLAAAYFLETRIPASRARLCQQMVTAADGGCKMTWWFEEVKL